MYYKRNIMQENKIKKGMYIYNSLSWYFKIGPFMSKPMYNNFFRINDDKETTQAPGYL